MPRSEQRSRAWGRRLAGYGGALLAGYGVWAALLYAKQDAMLFPRQFTNLRPGATAPAGCEVVTVTTAQGWRVEGWYRRGAMRSEQAPGAAVIFCHGNAELIDDNVGIMDEYASRGVGVLLIEYPGYGRSQGEPSQAAILDAATKFYDDLAARPEVDRSRIGVHGVSLGGGVAGQIAAARPVAAMVLEATFTSVASFAWGYGLPPLLVKHPFRTDEVVREFRGPIVLFHGTEDEIIPVDHGRALAALSTNATYVEMPGGHNDFPTDREAYWRAIDAWLAAWAQGE